MGPSAWAETDGTQRRQPGTNSPQRASVPRTRRVCRENPRSRSGPRRRGPQTQTLLAQKASRPRAACGAGPAPRGTVSLPTLPALLRRGRTPAPTRTRGNRRADAAPDSPRPGSGQHPEELRETARCCTARGVTNRRGGSPLLLREPRRYAANLGGRRGPGHPRRVGTASRQARKGRGSPAGRCGREDRELRAGGRVRGAAEERSGAALPARLPQPPLGALAHARVAPPGAVGGKARAGVFCPCTRTHGRAGPRTPTPLRTGGAGGGRRVPR